VTVWRAVALVCVRVREKSKFSQFSIFIKFVKTVPNSSKARNFLIRERILSFFFESQKHFGPQTLKTEHEK
jgi:hypothetical protein